MRPSALDGWEARVRTLLSDGEWHSSTEIRDAASRHVITVLRMRLLSEMGAEYRRVPTSGRPRDEWRVRKEAR